MVIDNFRFQSVYPTDTDINEDYPEPAENITHKAYDSTEHYLETHFRLLRADCILPVRDAIHSYRFGTVDDNDMTKYVNVSIDMPHEDGYQSLWEDLQEPPHCI